MADSSITAQNLSAQKGSATVGDGLQLGKKQLLLTEGWVKMGLSNKVSDKENWWKFLAFSACPCKERHQWEAGSARSLAQGDRVGQSLEVPLVLSRAGQGIAELQVQLLQQECVYYLSTCLQAPTLVFTFYLLKFYWCFQLRNWFSFPLLKQPQNRVYSVSDCKQLSWSTPKAAPLW